MIKNKPDMETRIDRIIFLSLYGVTAAFAIYAMLVGLHIIPPPPGEPFTGFLF